MDWETILATFLENITPVVVAIIGVLLLNLVKKYTKNAQIQQYVADAYDLLQQCVLCCNQTYVDALKEAGEFDKEAQEIARKKTLGLFKTLASEEMLMAIQLSHNSLESWLKTMVESDVWVANNSAA